MRNHNNKQKNNTFHIIYINDYDVVTLSCDNTLIFMYFTQNLLENCILFILFTLIQDIQIGFWG